MKTKITKFTSVTPLTKEIKLVSGVKDKTSSKPLNEGTGKVLTVEFNELPKIMEECTNKDVLCYGTPAKGLADFFTVSRTDKESIPNGRYGRNGKNFTFKKEPTVFFVDHDPKDDGKKMTPASLHAAFVKVCPEAFKCASYISRGSVSAGVVKPGEKPDPSAGFHLYYCAADGTDVVRFAEELQKRLWLAGFGFILVSRSGSALDRTVVDSCTTQAERIDYTGAPIVGPGLKHTPSKATYHDGMMLDTTKLKSLDQQENEAYKALVEEAKVKSAPECKKKRAVWVKTRVEKIMKQKGISKEDAADIVKEQLDASEKAILFGDYELHFKDFGWVTVREVCQDPDKYDWMPLCEPLEEPPYPSDSARLGIDHDGSVIVRSWGLGFAGKVYRLLEEDPKQPASERIDGSTVDRLIEELKTDPIAWSKNEYIDEFIEIESETETYESIFLKLKNAGLHLKRNIETAIANRKRFLKEEAKKDFVSNEEDYKESQKRKVLEMNEQYARVLISNKVRVMKSVKEGKFYKRIFLDKRDFLQLFEDDMVQVGLKFVNGEAVPVYKTAGEIWFSSPLKLSYDSGVKMVPETELEEGWFNLWQGFNINKETTPKKWDKTKNHIEKIICKDDPESIEYFYNWCAFGFQKPNKPAFSAMVLRGLKGAGKGVMMQFLMSFWKPHTKQITNSESLVGKFNAHLADVCFVFADEAFYGGDKKHESVLKGLITETTLNIERKGMEQESDVPSYLRLGMSTNEDWAVPTTGDERRFFVLNVSKELNDLKGKNKKAHAKYFDELTEEMKDEGCRLSFFNDMMKRDVSNFSPGDIPLTDGLEYQNARSLKPHQDWLQNCLEQGSWSSIPGFEKAEFRLDMKSKEYHALYLDYCSLHKVHKPEMMKDLNRYLTEVFGNKYPPSVDSTVKNIKSLDDARIKFEKYHKVKLTRENTNIVDLASRRRK